MNDRGPVGYSFPRNGREKSGLGRRESQLKGWYFQMEIPIFPLLRLVSSAAVPLFYGKVTVNGREALPKGGLLVVAGPHSNHLVDSVMLASTLGRRDVYFLAYSTLFKGALVGPILKRIDNPVWHRRIERLEDTLRLAFLRAMHLIPIHRERDGRSGIRYQRENLTVLLKEAAKRVAEGQVVVVYPDAGSPAGYTLGKVQAGAARLAIMVSEQIRGTDAQASIVCAGLNYTNFHEPYGSGVTVSFGEATDLHHLPTEPSSQPRQTLTRSFEEWLDCLAVIAPTNFPIGISWVAGILQGSPEPDIDHVRKAAAIVDTVNGWHPNKRDFFYKKIAEHYYRLRGGWALPGRLLAGTSEPSEVWWQALPLIVAVYAGIVINAIPLAVVTLMTARMPKHLWLRGQQFFGTAVSIFLLWYAGLLFFAAASPSLLALVATSAILGSIAARNYFVATEQLFRALNPERYRSVKDEAAQLQAELLSLEPAKESADS